MAQNYILRVTAGPSYDPSTHQQVPINLHSPLQISSKIADTSLNVRIQDYRGLPKSSPSTSPYFSTAPHDYNKDQYSIAFRFRLKKDMNANDLVFGNDFDHPIRDRLPPGFGTAMKIVKWGIDPGLDGDVYSDQPYLYGPFGSSINQFWVGTKSGETKNDLVENEEFGIQVEEGGDGEWRKEQGIPDSQAARRKWFLNENNRKGCDFEAGREYVGDFFNAYLDFNEFALRLPGFTLPIMRYWDGQGLRYVLKNRATGEVVFVVLFTLYLKEDIDEEGNVKEGVEGGKKIKHGEPGENDDEEEAEVANEEKAVTETTEDDVD